MKMIGKSHAIMMLVVAALLSVPFFSTGGRAEDQAQIAPDFSLKTHDGKTFQLSKLNGKRGALLVFFATWCPGCMAEVPEVIEFVKTVGEKPVLVYGVNLQQSQDVVDRFVKEKNVNYRILLDQTGEVASKYQVTGIPLLVGIDAAGRVRYLDHGFPKDKQKLIATLSEGVESSEVKEEPAMKTEAKTLGLRETASTDKDYVKDGINFISKETLQAWRQSDKSLVVVDVLSKESYDKAHVAGAVHLPYAELKEKAATLDKDATVVVYCANYQCHASTSAAEALTAMGFNHVYDYKGGIKEWKEAGLPVEP